jgi:hypothetical protein
MSTVKILNAATAMFQQNLSAFCRNEAIDLDKCNDETFSKLTKGLMDAARAAGQAGLSEYLSQHDIQTATMAYKGNVYRYKGQSMNEILTMFGTIAVNRSMYYDEEHGGDYLFPLDKALGLDKDDFATLDTREMILYTSSSCTPQETAELLQKCSLCRPSRTAIQNIIAKDGARMEQLRPALAQSVLSQTSVPEQTTAFVASLDGVNVLLREPGEKKGRKGRRPDKATTDTYKSPTSYHNAMVGAFSFYQRNDQQEPLRISSSYLARMPEENALIFKEDFQRAIEDVNGKISTGNHPIARVLLCDGHRNNWSFADSCQSLEGYEPLLDFFHSSEHLAGAADAMYGEKTDISKWWFTKWRDALKTDPDAPQSIIRSMQGFMQRNRLSKSRRKIIVSAITFFKRNKRLMNYPSFISRGLPIGSGPVEAAAKTIVKQRMCRSGMRWSRVKGQHILIIRAFVKSGVWNHAWHEYKQLRKAA